MDIERRKVSSPLLGDAEQDLMSLVDLQRFLAEELVDSVDITTDFSRSFTPLTDGLGIHSMKIRPAEPLQRFPSELPRILQQESPERPEPESPIEEFLHESVNTPINRPEASRPTQQPVRRFVDESAVEDEFDDDTAAPAASFRVKDQRLRKALGELENQELPELENAKTFTEPPPLPRASLVRRAMSAIMDQVFVWTLAILSVVFVTNVLSSDSTLFSAKMVKELAQPAFVKYIVAGFAALWLAYLTLTIGILEATFGMWIWGMKIHYGSEQRFTKKFARVGLSLLCQVAILPGLLMVFQRDGKNLIDRLSGSQVLRTQS